MYALFDQPYAITELEIDTNIQPSFKLAGNKENGGKGFNSHLFVFKIKP